MNALEIAQALIRFASVTPEDKGALAFIERLLSEAGFVCQRLPFASTGAPRIENLYARWVGEGPCLAFAGHTDVVPPGEGWRFDPFGGEVAQGRLWGRGAADMKGGVAASLAAALRFAKSGAMGAVAFLLTGDEEGPALDGTIKLVEWDTPGVSASTIACWANPPASRTLATRSRTAVAAR